MASDRSGVLVTLTREYADYAVADGKALHAKYGDNAEFGKRTEKGRIASSGARRAVEQQHGIAPGKLRGRGFDCVSTQNPNTDDVHIRPKHRGRIFNVAGPLDGVEAMLAGHAVFLIYGSIEEARAKARPIDQTLDPPAHVWHVWELDPPPAPRKPTGPPPRDPEQLTLIDQRAGRVHDREVRS